MGIEYTVGIDAPIEKVWDLTLDVESWPDHSSTMTSVERLDDGPLDVGSTARIKQPAQRARVWTVSHLEPPHRFAWSTTAMGATMVATHELASNGSGTTQTLRVEIEGRLSRLVAALLRRPIARAIAIESLGFKTAAERDAARSEPGAGSAGG